MEVATSPSPVKARKTTRDATPRSASTTTTRCAMHDVLHLEMVMQRVLATLPLADLAVFLSTFGGAPELAWLQEDAALWEELLVLHFGGRRSVALEARADQEEEGDNGFGGVGGFRFGGNVASDDEGEEEEDEDDEDEESDDEDEDDEASEQQVSGGAESSADAASLSESVPVLAETTDAVRASDGASEAEAVAMSTVPTSLPAELEMPTWMDADKTCDSAKEFMASLLEWTQFQQRVVVLRGDISTIQEINGHNIDAIAFPGNTSMTKPYDGAGNAVFRRAGRELGEYTGRLGRSLRAGECHVTPGFNSGVRVLIHCHGPFSTHPRVYETLGKTYRNVLRKAKEENASCLAMASISTGNLGVPIPQASKTAVRAIQQFMRANHEWQGRVGIVCYDGDVYEAFSTERQCLLDKFNAPAQ